MKRFLFLPLLFFSIAACETTEEVADTTADTAEDVADATADVAEDVYDAGKDVATSDEAAAVGDAADTAFDATTDAVGDAAVAVADLASDAYDEAREALGDDEVADDARVAVARISAPDDTTTSVRGTVTFVETASGVRVRYDLAGLSSGAHGLHVHAVGSCAPADADGDGAVEAAGAAGGHFDPLGTDDHGGPSEGRMDRHAGDLGNVVPGPGGRVTGTLDDDVIALTGATSVVGKAVIVHSGRDDLETDPSGGAGARVGCGVVELASM